MARPVRCPALLACTLLACSGRIGAPATEAPAPGEPGSPDTPAGPQSASPGTASPGATSPGGTPTPTPAVPAAAGLGEAPETVRRLTIEEYRNTITDLIGASGSDLAPTNPFLPDGRVALFTNNVNAPVAQVIAQQYMEAAEALAANAVKYHLKNLTSCDPTRSGEEPCARDLVSRFGKRALRRPLADDEVESFVALYRAGRAAGKTHADGLRLIVQALLQSPEFLYHLELGDPARATPERVPLTDHELASRLSYMLWSSLPDDGLFAAADAGKLRTVEGLRDELDRLLALPRAQSGFVRFFREWLGFGSYTPVYNNPVFSSIQPYLTREPAAFIQASLFTGDAKLGTLLTAPYSFLNGALAAVYGVAGPSGTELAQTPVDPKQRAGLLTMPVFMANTANPDGMISPVRRGNFVRLRYLCQEMPPPPPDAGTLAPKLKGNPSQRQRTLMHATDPYCSGCHRLMDPIGVGFDHYMATGAYVAKYTGSNGSIPADPTDDDDGEVFGTDLDGKFKGVPELAAKLAASRQVRDCVATQLFRYAVARGETPGDDAALAAIRDRFSATGGNVKELIVAVVTSDPFRTLSRGKEASCQ